MKTSSKLILPALMLALLGSTAASASPGFTDTAWVVARSPVYERVNEPQRDCWTEQVGYESVRNRDRSYGGAVLGTIVGGILGNQIGKGSGKSVATAVGAATGAIVGDNMDNRDRAYASERRPAYEERCEVRDNWSQHLTGYNVTYRYQGHDYTTFLPYDPGRSVKVRVNVNLAERD